MSALIIYHDSQWTSKIMAVWFRIVILHLQIVTLTLVGTFNGDIMWWLLIFLKKSAISCMRGSLFCFCKTCCHMASDTYMLMQMK